MSYRTMILIAIITFHFNGWASCIMHKGDHKNFPENSLSAIKQAFQNGAHGSEFDIRHTKDGVPILHHDSKFGDQIRSKENKICNKDLKISQQLATDVFSNCELKNGEEIPKLSTVLKEFENKDFTLLVELKDIPSEKTNQHPQNKQILSQATKRYW